MVHHLGQTGFQIILKALRGEFCMEFLFRRGALAILKQVLISPFITQQLKQREKDISRMYWLFLEGLLYLMLGKQSNTFSLVEDWKMWGVNFISPVDIPHDNKAVQAAGNELFLVGAGVASQYEILIQVVAIWRLSTGVVLTNQQTVPILN